MSKFKEHKRRWSNCERCELHKHRKKVVLLRGNIPCEVLFIGEAPGHGEDTIGRPFIGEAGKLLDKLILQTEKNTKLELKTAFTNLVSCIPLDKLGVKTQEPKRQHIKQCGTRLKEITLICRPKLIVYVGKLSQSYSIWINKIPDKKIFRGSCTIIHPAAILRSKSPQKEFAIRKTINTLSEAYTDYFTK